MWLACALAITACARGDDLPSAPLVPSGTVQTLGGSCRLSKGRVCIGDPVKSIPKPSTERAVVDRATNLEQQIVATS
jgi:hypothetical protein